MEQRKITVQKKDGSVEVRIVSSLVETERLATDIASGLSGGEVLALSGDLGAGKTAFVSLLAKALGITDTVTSPTFVLMRTYDLPRAVGTATLLCHVDAYRMKSAFELEAIGAEDYMGTTDTIAAIEWPERVARLIPKDALRIHFEIIT